MATYRIYQDRNAWAGLRNGVQFQGSLTSAKLHAESIGFTHIEKPDQSTLYAVNGLSTFKGPGFPSKVWRKA